VLADHSDTDVHDHVVEDRQTTPCLLVIHQILISTASARVSAI
jgi:hypothetical protein